jgi:hypothetical protein
MGCRAGTRDFYAALVSPVKIFISSPYSGRITQQAGQAVVLASLSLSMVLRLDLRHTVSLHNHLYLVNLSVRYYYKNIFI